MIFPIENLNFVDIFNLKPADKYSLGKGSVILYRKGVPNLLAEKKKISQNFCMWILFFVA